MILFNYVVVNNKWILQNQKMDDHKLRDVKISFEAIETYQSIASNLYLQVVMSKDSRSSSRKIN